MVAIPPKQEIEDPTGHGRTTLHRIVASDLIFGLDSAMPACPEST